MVGLVLGERPPRAADGARVREHVALGEDAVVARRLDGARVRDAGEREQAQDRGQERLRVLRVGVDRRGRWGGRGGGGGRRVGGCGGGRARLGLRVGGRGSGRRGGSGGVLLRGDLDVGQVVALLGEDGDELADRDARCAVVLLQGA